MSRLGDSIRQKERSTDPAVIAAGQHMAHTAEWARLEYGDCYKASWDAAAPHRRYAMRQAISRYRIAFNRSRQRDAIKRAFLDAGR